MPTDDACWARTATRGGVAPPAAICLASMVGKEWKIYAIYALWPVAGSNEYGTNIQRCEEEIQRLIPGTVYACGSPRPLLRASLRCE